MELVHSVRTHLLKIDNDVDGPEIFFIIKTTYCRFRLLIDIRKPEKVECTLFPKPYSSTFR
jgi:hypothetical protein